MSNTSVHTLNRSSNDRLDAIHPCIEAPGNSGTYDVCLSAPYGFTIDSFTHKLAQGSLTAAVKINGVDVTGLSAVSVTTAVATTNATAANTVSAGDRITVVVSGGSGTPLKFAMSFKLTRNGSEGA